MNAAFLSVIIPARDAADTVIECLKALNVQSLPRERYEVIVVDDGSADETSQIAERYADLVIRQERRGPAAARNAGATASRGELLIFTDADCVPAPDFLEVLSGAFRDPEIVAAKGAYRTGQQGLVPRFVQQEYQHKYARMERRSRIDFIDTYAAAYRRKVFQDSGGFDVSYSTASVEDQELSFRLAHKGYAMAFVPSALVFHRHDRSAAEYARRKFGIGFWKAMLLRRHPDRLMSDSHTPLEQRLQLLVAPLALLFMLLGPFYRWALWGLAACLALLGVSAVSELRSIARRDPLVLLVAPGMIVLRALALAAGLGAGAVVLRPRPS